MRRLWNFIKKHKAIIGGLWAFIATCLSLYLSFFPPEQNPKLTFYQKAKIDAFTIDQSVDDLQILFHGIDIRKSGLNLKIFKYKLINNGKRDIKASDYVDEIPFGIKIKNGKVARVGIGSNRITGNILNKINEDSTKIICNKLFIGKGDFVNLDIWIIHNKGVEPELSSIGRIADTNTEMTAEPETDAFGLLDTLRTLLALGLLLLGLFIAVFVLLKFQYYLQYVIRYFVFKRRIGSYYDSGNRIHRFLLKLFCKNGKHEFQDLTRPLLNEESLTARLVEEEKNKRIVSEFTNLKNAKKVEVTDKKFHYESNFLKTLDVIKKEEFAKEINGLIFIDEVFKGELSAILKRFNQ